MDIPALAKSHGLSRVGARPGLLAYYRETWRRRRFAIVFAKSKIRARNSQNRLGVLWEILKPTFNALMYGFIFGVLQGDRRPPGFAAFVVIGVFLMDFFSKSMSDGARSITGNRALVQSLAFPRATLPFSIVIQQILTQVPMLGVMFIYVMALGYWPRWEWLLIIPLFAIYAVFNMGVAFSFARLTVHTHDLTQLLPVINRFFFFTSGVLFSVESIFEQYPSVVAVYDYHPIYQVLTIARGLVLGGSHTYDPMAWVVVSCWAVGLFLVGTIFFWRAEELYGRVS
ncbi:ABC transporter permease [Pseudoglutamicibacter cumminsii]|uniref:Transport permease protein n=1 Tax=Pseudoglutamicibacter cumminsii TaxID=156979 RepID=A0AAP4C682_9MICC|nr:ABC transporter permease [Pseudoglutamicibacter cumminsii]MDK6274297.1 ABC transporter permease [Pseudoglutamicibacter cumminsii]